MRNSGVPIDGEPCGILAIPIPERGDPRFAELVDRFLDALGRSGADHIVWRPIANPRSTDEAYEQMRSPEQAKADEYSAGKYDSYVAKRGGERHHRSREVNTLAALLRIGDESRPCIVFRSSPSLGRKIILRIPRNAFQSRDSENVLGDWLVENISCRIVEDVLNDGFLNKESMVRLELRLAELERDLYGLLSTTEAALKLPRTAFARLVVGMNESYISRDEYDDLVASRRRTFQLFVDVLGGNVYCRKGPRQRTVPLRPRAVRILAEVIAAGRPIRIRETNTGELCASDDAAINAFHEARAAVQRSGRYAPPLFSTRRSFSAGRATYLFSPPETFLWGIVGSLK